MARTRTNPLMSKPYTIIAREDRGRMPTVVLPSIPSKIRKHHAGNGQRSLLVAIRSYSGAIVTVPGRAREQKRSDHALKRRYKRVRDALRDGVHVSDSYLQQRTTLIKMIGPRETIPRGTN